MGNHRGRAVAGLGAGPGDHVHAIPGTTKSEHLAENMSALDVELDRDQLAQLDAVINNETIHGNRYNSHQQKTVESEEF